MTVLTPRTLARDYRRALRAVAHSDRSQRLRIAGMAVADLIEAARALRLPPRAVAEYLGTTLGPLRPDRRRMQGWARRFAAALPPTEERRANPLRGASEENDRVLRSPRLCRIQSRVLRCAFAQWFGLALSPADAAVLGAFAGVAATARNLMQAAGVSPQRRRLDDADRRRIRRTLGAFVQGRAMERDYRIGIGDPPPRRRPRLFRRRRPVGVTAPAATLYPESLDRQDLEERREVILRIRDALRRRITARAEARIFENYLHLQSLTLGAPSRGPERLGRYLAAVERRHA